MALRFAPCAAVGITTGFNLRPDYWRVERRDAGRLHTCQASPPHHQRGFSLAFAGNVTMVTNLELTLTERRFQLTLYPSPSQVFPSSVAAVVAERAAATHR